MTDPDTSRPDVAYSIGQRLRWGMGREGADSMPVYGYTELYSATLLSHSSPGRIVHEKYILASGDPTGETPPVRAAPKSADRHDFPALYQMWFRRVRCWIRRLGGPGIDDEDLTQEVFIVVHRKLDQFDGANVAGWLHRIAQLTVRDHRQRAWFRKIFLRSRDVPLDQVMSRVAVQDEQLDDKQRALRFYQLVAQLNPRWRDSFVLFELAGLTGEEIASVQGIPAATVRSHVCRARKELAELVQQLPASDAR
jgi:RNA polymerase sigma-70 factor, ECF subfamily